MSARAASSRRLPIGTVHLRSFLRLARKHSYIESDSYKFWNFDARNRRFEHQSGFVFDAHTVSRGRVVDQDRYWAQSFAELIRFESEVVRDPNNVLATHHQQQFILELLRPLENTEDPTMAQETITLSDSEPIIADSPQITITKLFADIAQGLQAGHTSRYLNEHGVVEGGATALKAPCLALIDILRTKLFELVATEKSESDAHRMEKLLRFMPAAMCSISHRLMLDPVCTSDGHTYDRSSINKWFNMCEAQGKSPTSPMTGDVVSSNITSNISLKSTIMDMMAHFEVIYPI
jgi:hypothetical protein